MNSTQAASAELPRAAIAAQPGRQQGQDRPHPLAAGGDDVAGQLGDQADLALHLVEDDPVDLLELAGDERADPVELRGGISAARLQRAGRSSSVLPRHKRYRAGVVALWRANTHPERWQTARPRRPPQLGCHHLVEVVRSNDLVHLSWAQAMLAADGIDCLLADTHISSVEGSIGAFPRRLLVLDEDRERAVRVLAEAAGAGSMTSPAEPDLSEDRLLGGRLRFSQPRRGYRAAIDPVLLAAAVPAQPGERVLDVGTGTGAAALVPRRPRARLPVSSAWSATPELLAIARRNVAANGSGTARAGGRRPAGAARRWRRRSTT